MGTDAPRPIVIPLDCAPKKAPCPHKRGRRNRTLTRNVRTVASKAVAFLEITYGEYTACCKCSTTFRTSPEGVAPKAQYDNRVRELVLDRLTCCCERSAWRRNRRQARASRSAPASTRSGVVNPSV
jgi:hypothetical protein